MKYNNKHTKLSVSGENIYKMYIFIYLSNDLSIYVSIIVSIYVCIYLFMVYVCDSNQGSAMGLVYILN